MCVFEVSEIRLIHSNNYKTAKYLYFVNPLSESIYRLFQGINLDNILELLCIFCISTDFIVIILQTDIDSESEPLDVESSLQRLAVKEVQVASWGEAIRRLEAKIDSHVKAKDAAVLHNQLSKLRQAHQR